MPHSPKTIGKKPKDSLRLNEDAIQDYPPHKFKKNEWNCTKKELIDLLTTYRQALVWPSWQPNDIDHFLSCYFHIVGSVMFHHKRCIATLIRQGVIRRSVHRLGAMAK